jgi:hypothetical protein
VCDRESVQIRFTVSREWVEDELLPAFPAVTNRSEAARTAVQEAVQARQDGALVCDRIDERVADLLGELAGSVSNNQTITINDPEAVDIAEAGEVQVGDDE